MGDVGDDIRADSAAWSFDGIAPSFDEHVRKSVPLYEEGHELVCQLSEFFLPAGAHVLELGCSTGALARRLLQHNAKRSDIHYTGIDSSGSMVEAATERCAGDLRASFVHDDVVALPFERSSLIVSYYTLQFVHPRCRQDVIDKVYQALEWGGAFLLFEKVRAPDARFQDISTQLYHEFKLARGFDEAEILNKQRSLKGVLEPFSTQGNLDLLTRAGFVDVTSVMKWVCFEGFLAIK